MLQALERGPAGGRPAGGGVTSTPPPPRRGGGGRPEGGLAADPARMGLWFFLGTVAMLFIGFTSAYLVRRASFDWREVPMPALFWLNTVALAASSAALETARRRGRARGPAAAQGPFWLAAGLGLLFAAGQVLAWRELLGQGVLLSTTPHASFLYVLSGAHLVHVAGGLLWAGAAGLRLRRAAGPDPLALFATFWHFLGVLWLYLLALLFVL